MRRIAEKLLMTAAGVLLAAALVIIAIGPAQAQASVKNYFSQANAGGDNILHIGGTLKGESGGSIDTSAATFKVNGATVATPPVKVFVAGTSTAGKSLAFGQQTTVSATDTVVTGLASVTACIASYDTDVADANYLVTCTVGDQAGAPVAGSVIIKTWQNTTGTDPTPVAAAAFSKKVNWMAWGS